MKGLSTPQRGRDPQVENHWSTKSSSCLTELPTVANSQVSAPLVFQIGGERN